MLNGLSAYLFPVLELLKLCYWYQQSSKILGSAVKLLQIKKEYYNLEMMHKLF